MDARFQSSRSFETDNGDEVDDSDDTEKEYESHDFMCHIGQYVKLMMVMMVVIIAESLLNACTLNHLQS